MELKRGCEAGILAKGDRDKVVMCMRVAKSRGGGGGWAKGKLTSRHNMAKPRVLAVTGQSVSPSHLPIHAMLTRARMLLTISSSCFTRAWLWRSQGQRAQDQDVPAGAQILQWRGPRGDLPAVSLFLCWSSSDRQNGKLIVKMRYSDCLRMHACMYHCISRQKCTRSSISTR